MLTVSMSKMSSVIIGTQNCNSMDTVAEILHKLRFSRLQRFLVLATAYQLMPGGSGFQPSTAVAPLLLHLDLADPPPQLAT